MSVVSAYILTVTAAAILAAILRVIAGEGHQGSLVNLLTGIFMALTIISPLMRLELPDPALWFSGYAEEGAAAAASGESMAKEVSAAIITERVEAYILDKAAIHQENLEVSVTLDETGAPASVTLTGPVSAYAKERLSRIIEEDLGIAKEAQQWMG